MNVNESPMYSCADGSVVKFEERPVQHKAKSDAAGRPIYWTALLAVVHCPGMKNQVVGLEVELRDENGKVIRRKVDHTKGDGTPVYRDEMFREQLKAWRDNKTGTDAIGTPLQMYPRLDVAQIASLQGIGINTLEALAAVPDSLLHQVTNGRSMRDGAKAYLEAANGGAPIERLNAANAELEEKLKIMAERLAALEGTAPEAETTETEPKKRGRPPKVENQAA